jgi:putative flavoprotein involved in K+ transport
VPPSRRGLPADVVQLVPSRYRRASQLPRAGCSWSARRPPGPARGRDPRLGAAGDARGRPPQRACRELSRPRHRLVARRHGRLRRGAEDVSDLARTRSQPSLQLVGRPDRATLDLPALERRASASRAG